MKYAPTVVSFDYSQLPADVADEARAIAERVRDKTRSMTLTILELGRDLMRVKARLGHGTFGIWLEAEFSGGARTAQNYMRAFEAFGDKCEIVSHLPPATVYALAAPSVPERTRAKVVQRLSAGEAMDAGEVRAIVRDAKKRASRRRDAAARKAEAPTAAPPAGQGAAAPRLSGRTAARQAERAQKIAELFRARLTAAELETLLGLAKGSPEVWQAVGKTLAGRNGADTKASAGPLFDLVG
jgi:Protein of unknown function (DUF3102)